jgi:hypothetical protein
MSGMFYKATIQVVLLYSSETCILPPSSIKQLEWFHIRAAWQMSGLQLEKKPNGSWSCPCSVDVLEKAGLERITHYMGVRQQTVANFIVNQPIWELCAGAVRKRGSPIQPFWWDQPMDLDLAKERGLQPPSPQTMEPAIVEDEDKEGSQATESNTN